MTESFTAVNLETLLRAEGRFAEAESVLLDCIRRAEALEPAGSGKRSVEWAYAARSLGARYLAWQQLDKAETSPSSQFSTSAWTPAIASE